MINELMSVILVALGLIILCACVIILNNRIDRLGRRLDTTLNGFTDYYYRNIAQMEDNMSELRAEVAGGSDSKVGGTWVYNSRQDCYYCPCCGEKQPASEVNSGKVWSWCPVCGALLRMGEENEPDK